MLRQIRGTMKTAAALLFAVPLIIAFAAWGVPEIRQLTQSYAVRVGKTGISALEVQTEFDRYATNRRLSGDDQFDRSAAVAAGLHNQIVRSLAARTAIDEESAKMGLSIPRDMVREFLQTSDQFKNPRTGKFDNEALSEILRQYDYGIRDFEDRLRSDLLRNQLLSSIGVGGNAPKALVNSLVLRETETRTVSYLTITEDLAGEAPEASPETLTAFYEQNTAQFMAPEYRTFAAIILKNSDYVDTQAVSDEELMKAYEDNKARFETPERRTVYQITFPDDETAKAALDAVNGGKPFETLATENGKTLAEVTLTDALKSDILDPKVADAVFDAAESGATVGPVKGVFGYTVAQVAAISSASVKPFEEVRGELQDEMQTKGSKKKLFDTIDAIENERDTGASLSEAATRAGTIAIEYGPVDSYSFGAGGEIVAGVPGDVLREAFKLEEGDESDVTELQDKSGYFFVAVTEVTPPAAIPYEDVADEVLAKWTAQERQTRISRVVKTIRESVDGGKTLKEAAEQFNRAPITEALSRRNAVRVFSPSVLEQAFSAAKGEAVSGPSAIGDAEIVVTIDGVGYDVASVNPNDIAGFGQYVGGQLGQELMDAYSEAVLSDAKVKIDQAQIDAIFSDGQ